MPGFTEIRESKLDQVMTLGSLSDRIDNLEKRLAYRCHHFVFEENMTRNQIAGAAGLSWTLVKNIKNPDFDPSLKPLRPWMA